MKHFSIIIPTLNEGENIKPLLYQLGEVTRSHGMEPEVIFIDDGSTDNTRQAIQTYRGKLDVTLICRDNERGLTSAVIKGAHVARHEVVVVMDADLSHSPKMIPALLRPLEDDSYDMTIGSRYVEGGQTPGLSAFRRVGSKVASLGARLFTSVQDPLSGFFAVKRQQLTLKPVAGEGFKIGLELLARADKGFRVSEVPITFKDRHNGVSKMTLAILSTYFLQLIRLAGKRVNWRELEVTFCLSLLCGLLGCALFSTFSTFNIKVSTAHILSLLIVSHFMWYISYFVFSTRSENGFLKGYLTFLLVVLLGLFLQGGILPLWVDGSSPELWTNILFFVTTTLTIASALLVTINKSSILTEPGWKQLGMLLIGYSLLLRLFYLGGPELIQEEAYYWNYSQHMATGYLDHPPMVALLIKLGTMLFGDNEFGVRIGAFICWIVTALFSWRLTRLLLDKDTAFRALVLIALLPIFFGTGLLMTPDAPLIACWAGALYYLYRALVQMHPQSWYGAGLFLGLGMVSKYTIAFLGPAIILFMLLDLSARRYFLRPQPYLAALLALIVFSPVAWWNYHNDWASFLFQSQGRIQAGSEFSTHELLAGILILLTPTGLVAIISMLRPGFISAYFQGHNNATVKRGFIFGLVMAAIPLAILILFSITKEVKLNWTGPLWLAVIPFIALTIIRNGSMAGGRMAGLWTTTLLVLGLSYGALLHYCTIGLPGIPYSQGDFLFGWENFAQQVEDEVQKIAEQQGERPLVAGLGKYKIASGLAFYRHKLQSQPGAVNPVAETTGRQLFGYKALMYGYWHPPSVAKGRDVLVISARKNWLDATVYNDRYQDLGTIREFTVHKNGKEAGRYYYRLVIGFTPDGKKKSQTHSTLPVSSGLTMVENKVVAPL